MIEVDLLRRIENGGDAHRSGPSEFIRNLSGLSMSSNLKVLVAHLAFVLVINSAARVTGCCTSKPDCEGLWTATADVFPVVCWRVNYVNGQKAIFCLRRGQTRQVKVRSGDTASYWAGNAPVPADRFATPVCTD